MADHIIFIALQSFLGKCVSHGAPFTRMVRLVDDREDVVANGLSQPGVEVCFLCVGFGTVDVVECGAGVECQAVGAVTDD